MDKIYFTADDQQKNKALFPYWPYELFIIAYILF